MKKIKKSDIILLLLYIIMIILNLAAWLSSAFSDWYARYVLPVWVNSFSRLTSFLPFSLGEMMIIAGVAIVVFGLITYIILMIFGKGKRKKISRVALRIFLWIVLFIFTTETMNCFIMYHCTLISDEHFSDTPEEYTEEQIVDVYEELAKKLNELSGCVSRDEEGSFILTDDLYETARESMNGISDEYPLLKGYYPQPKKIMFSKFFSQQYLMGVFFPFSLEVNYNSVMNEINYPETICHEYAHLKGIMQEDEAGFLAFAACTGSESADFRYSGYLSVLVYLENDIFEYITEGSQAKRAEKIWLSIDPVVRADDVFLTDDAWNDVEETAVISTAVVDEVSDTLMDTSLKINGVDDGMASYGRKVKLLLDYYVTKGSL